MAPGPKTFLLQIWKLFVDKELGGT